MDENCIFCKIIAGELTSQKVYEDDRVFAFRDIRPVAPIHVLIVPKKHIESVNALTESDEPLVGYLVTVARKLAAQEGIAESGYRLVFNNGPDSGQEVYHLHLHLLGGHRLHVPMG